jgi:hypothetical protein
MARPGVVVQVAAGLGLLLMPATLLSIDAYGAAARVETQLSALDHKLTQAVSKLRGGLLRCSAPTGSAGRLGWEEFRDSLTITSNLNHQVAMAAFEADRYDHLMWAVQHRFPGTDGLHAVYDVSVALSRMLSETRTDWLICGDPQRTSSEQIAEEERRSQTVVEAAQRGLEAFGPQVRAAHAQLRRDLPLLRALAWGLGSVETLGMMAFVLYVRQMLRGRRQAAHGP